MSFWSMLKNTFRTPRQRRTRHTISLVWQDGLTSDVCRISLPKSVENMLQRDQLPQHVVIWRHSGPPSDIGSGKEGLLGLCLLSLSHQSQSRATGGSYEQRLRDYYKARGIPRIFADLSYSQYIRERDQERS